MSRPPLGIDRRSLCSAAFLGRRTSALAADAGLAETTTRAASRASAKHQMGRPTSRHTPTRRLWTSAQPTTWSSASNRAITRVATTTTIRSSQTSRVTRRGRGSRREQHCSTFRRLAARLSVHHVRVGHDARSLEIRLEPVTKPGCGHQSTCRARRRASYLVA